MSELSGPDLARLTGVRSGKGSYYRAFVRSDERMQRTVRAMDVISRALVRTVEGPRGLLEEVARAASDHLDAIWVVLALSDGHLRGARPRFMAVDAEGRIDSDESDLSTPVRRELVAIRSGFAQPSADQDTWVRVPMTLEGRVVGGLAALHGLDQAPEPEDLAVLRILANQAAVSLHTSEQYQASLTLHRRAQRLYHEATTQARDLAQRTEELREAEHRLAVARQRELVDAERHRIARELHDSVTQYVLSAGMSVELARGESERLGATGEAATHHLETAKSLSKKAVEQLRSAIYALTQPHSDTVSPLPDLLAEVVGHHRPHLDVQMRVDGEPAQLPHDAHHQIARAVGEALFNVAAHAGATRAVVRVRYRPDMLTVAVADDGQGDPTTLSRLLRLERSGTRDGRHQGLANMEARVAELGGTLLFRRARLGGVRVIMRVPLPLPPSSGDQVVHNLMVDAPQEETWQH